jgi:hypothetical protein
MQDNKVQPTLKSGVYKVSNPELEESGFPVLNNRTSKCSQILEPEIINTNNSKTNKDNSQDMIKQNLQEEMIPSETTSQTKTYVGGGTIPDSNIIVKKPSPNYFLYGITGVIGAYVVYRFFLNKKMI